MGRVYRLGADPDGAGGEKEKGGVAVMKGVM